MFYKILFEDIIDYDKLLEVDDAEGNPLETQINQYTGLDSVIFSNSLIDLLMNSTGEIEGLQICSECTKTFNIESHLLQLAYKLTADTNITSEVFDGNGFTEIMDSETLHEYSNQ